MSSHCNQTSGRIMDLAETGREESRCHTQSAATALSDQGDDRYPGTFFRIPGVPVPGKTSWNLVP